MQTLPMTEMHQREWLLQNQPDRVTILQFCLDLTICLSLSIKHTCTSHISAISTCTYITAANLASHPGSDVAQAADLYKS